MEIQDETELKLSSGVVDIVLDGVEEFISLNGYTYLNGTLELLEDEGIIINNVGGGGIKVINYFNYNKLTEDVEGKQDEITTSTDLSCNSLNTNQLIVNDDLYFDTIVIRRPTGASYDGTDFIIALLELQCWVGGSNIMINGDIIRYFAEFTNKDEDVGSLGVNRDVTNINNNNIETPYLGAVSSTDYNNENISLICKEIPRTKIQDIQSIVLYNRSYTTLDRAIGLAIELYNRDIDPNLETPLASTAEITTGEDVYRYDFPAIGTYPSGDFSDTNSISQIASETLALKEVVSEFAESANITGGLKVDTITTTGNIDVGGVITAPNQPCFKMKCNNMTSSGAGTNLNYDGVVIDNYSAYDIDERQYVVPVAGNWFFYYSFQSNDAPFQVRLEQNETTRDQCYLTNMNPVLSDPEVGPETFNSIATKGSVILPCAVNDTIRIIVEIGSVRLGSVGEFASFGGFLIG